MVIKVIIVMFLAVLLLLCAINTYMMGAVEEYMLTVEQAADLGADCVIVLGARVYDNGSLSPMLADRVNTGIHAWKAGAGSVLLLSGDHGTYGYDEVNAMKNHALQSGVPKEDIFLDHAGFCTYDSIVRAKEVFGAGKVVVVTQSFHLYRALYIARSIGLEAYGVPSDLRPYRWQLYNEGREMLARTKDFFSVIFRPDPKYLGEPIDLNGSYLASWD